MINKIKNILSAMSVFISGMVASSFWITKSDNWGIYLPILLIILSLNSNLREDNNNNT